MLPKFNNKKEDLQPPIFNKLWRPKLGRNDLLQKIKEVAVSVRLSRAVISRKTVNSIGNGVFKANHPNNLSELGEHITLTDNWDSGTLKSMDWVKRKGTTEKIEPFPQLLAEELLFFIIMNDLFSFDQVNIIQNYRIYVKTVANIEDKC